MRSVFGLAWHSLRLHTLRGLLAVGGVAIGITAITGIISAETSWSRALDQTFQQLGVTHIAVNPPDEKAEAMRRTLTLDDVEAVRRECTRSTSVLPLSWAGMLVKVGRNVQEVTVKAADVGVEDALGLQMTAGRKLTAQDVASRAPVCLVWGINADALFREGQGLGKTLRIAGRAFTVVGIFQDNSGDHHYRQTMVGRRAEVYIPITTAQRIPQLNGVHKMIVKADDQVGAAAQVNVLLRSRLRAKANAEFTVSAASMKEAARRSRQRVSTFVALAGFLALLVAGLGIANLLFVSVTERAREIGLRRALGASSWSIAAQFLAEAMVLCLAGAAAGVAAAFALTRGFYAITFPDTVAQGQSLSNFAPEQLATVQLPGAAPTIAWSALGIAALAAVLTGLFAGTQPAFAAARLAPAESLRTNPTPRHQARGVLTVFQVALGVATVLLLVSLYEGRAQTELSSLREGQAADLVWLQFGDQVPGQVRNNSGDAIYGGLREVTKLLKEPTEFRSLLDDLNRFDYFDPRMRTRVSVRAGARALRLREQELPTVYGTVPGAFEVDVARARAADLLPKGAGPLVAAGQFFSDADFDAARRVCMLPASAARELFGSADPVGQTVVIAGRPYTVSGVFAPWIEGTGVVLDVDSQAPFPVCVPATTFAREITDFPTIADQQRAGWYGITLRVKDIMQGPAALRQLDAALLPRIRLPKYGILYLQGNLVAAVDIATRQRWAELRAGVGGVVTLLIALVGLVNMLLVSVHESVREVGLRRAMGALRSQIGWQFLREGAALSIAGALAGLLIGIPAGHWLARFVDVPMHVPVSWALISGVGAVLAGCLASVGPALKAALIQPIEALRYE
jgi:putative ABC transport system permease protein